MGPLRKWLKPAPVCWRRQPISSFSAPEFLLSSPLHSWDGRRHHLQCAYRGWSALTRRQCDVLGPCRLERISSAALGSTAILIVAGVEGRHECCWTFQGESGADHVFWEISYGAVFYTEFGHVIEWVIPSHKKGELLLCVAGQSHTSRPRRYSW